jgi:folate-binding protein YgfZ
MIINLLEHFFSAIKVEGKDSDNFLQGQLTNDIRLANEKFIYSGLCNPKGRLFAFFYILKFNGAYFLICPKAIAESIQKKLNMYILRSDVSISIDEKINIYGSFDQPVDKSLKEIKNNFSYHSFSNNKITIKIPGDKARFLIIHEEFIDYNEISIDASSWIIEDLKSGIPFITKETQEVFLAHTCNLDLINAINFKKGCYTGQEIIARTHYLGKPKHRSYFGIIGSQLSAPPGTEVKFDGKKVGTLVMSSYLNNNTYILFETTAENKTKSLTINDQLIGGIKSFTC